MEPIPNMQSPAGYAWPGIGMLQQKLPGRLAEVLRRALIATGGNGAAIALMHNNVMVTCARAGCAPDLGSRVNMNGSFAGLCVRTGRTLRSDHLETDPRVNGAAWRALNVSSMVVTPVRHGDAIVGVLAVFAQQPHAFLSSHCVALEILALVLDITPPPKRPPANYYPLPVQVREPSQKPAPPPHETPKLPETTSVHSAAAVPPVPSAGVSSLPSVATAKKNLETPQEVQRSTANENRGEPLAPPCEPPQSPETTSVHSPVAAVPTRPSAVAPSWPSAAAAPKSVKTPQEVRRSSAKENRGEPLAPPQEPPQSLETTSVRSPVAAVPTRPSAVAPSLPSAAAAPKTVETPHILRFRKSERMLHWSIAVPFLVCFASALILVIFYNPHPQRAYRLVFSLLHRISGACLLLIPAVTAVRNRSDHRIHLYNIKEAFTWVADDVKWLFLMGAAALSSKVSLPEQGKFNAAEKLNFIMVLCTYPLFIASGLILWRLHVAFAAWMLHVGMAAMAAPLVLGHIFMATINPETRVGLSGMLTGYVDRHWARHHYTRWYREHFEDGHARDHHPGEKQARRQTPLVPCPSETKL